MAWTPNHALNRKISLAAKTAPEGSVVANACQAVVTSMGSDFVLTLHRNAVQVAEFTFNSLATVTSNQVDWPDAYSATDLDDATQSTGTWTAAITSSNGVYQLTSDQVNTGENDVVFTADLVDGDTSALVFNSFTFDPELDDSGTATPVTRKTILALGDSLVRGDDANSGSYKTFRGQLWQLLNNAGYWFDFIGTQTLAPSVPGDIHHDGYGGAYIDSGGSSNNITDRLSGILSLTGLPDVIVLLVGWNSVYNEAAANIAADYTALVNAIRAASPGSKIVLCSLPPQRGQTEGQTGTDLPGYANLNGAIDALVSGDTLNVFRLADLAAGAYVSGDYWDVIHPLQTGANKIAQIIFNAVVATGVMVSVPAGEQAPVPAPAPAPSPGPAPAPTPGGASITDGVVNTAQKAVDDMVLTYNDGTMINWRPYQNTSIPVGNWPDYRSSNPPTPGVLKMGARPIGSEFASWWQPQNPAYRNSNFWTHYLGWAVVQEASSPTNYQARVHNSNNCRIAAKYFQAYWRNRSSGAWTLFIRDVNCASWFLATEDTQFYVPGAVSQRTAADGATELVWVKGSGRCMHLVSSASAGGYSVANGRLDMSSVVADMNAICVTVWMKLVPDNPSLPNDLAQANLLAYVGGDWYPNSYASASEAQPPAFAHNRIKRLTTTWQPFNAVSLLDCRSDHLNSSQAAISAAQFIADVNASKLNLNPIT